MLNNLQGIRAFISAQNRYGRMSVSFSNMSPGDDNFSVRETKIEHEIAKYFEKLERIKTMP